MPPVIDGFTDLVEVGRGGFGTVYRARQVDPARDVAVKVLPDVRADSDAYGRFTREFQALAAVGGHPNIATVHACGVTVDSIGVYVQTEHSYISGILGSSRAVDGHTVMRLEPLPADQCAGGSDAVPRHAVPGSSASGATSGPWCSSGSR